VIDVIIVAAFIIYSVAIGLAARREASRDLTEYFLAGRRVRGWRSGLSMAATQFAADTPLLVMGLLAVGGVYSLWRLWIYGLAFLLMGFVLGAAWRRANVITDAEFTLIRYSARGAVVLRALKAVYYGTVINCVVLAMVLVAAMRVFEIFLPWHDWLPASFYAGVQLLVTATGLELTSGVTALPTDIATTNNVISILSMLLFVGLYSTTGGLRGVIATDVMQLALMLAGTLIYAWIAVDRAGGLTGLSTQLIGLYGPETAARFLSFTPPWEEAWLPFVVIISLQWFYQMNSDGTGYLAQRTMACADDRQARIAAVTFTFVQIVVRSLLWLLIGIALLIIFPFDAAQPMTESMIAERELVFVNGMDTLLPAGARGLMLTAMLAALASTVDTHLNWGAGYWSNDLYKGIWRERILRRPANSRSVVRVARLSNLFLIAIALVIMVNLESIQTAWQISLLFGAGTGAVLVLRWLWERVNLYAEIFAILVSLSLAPLLILFMDAEWLRLAVMAAVSTLVVVAAAIWMPQTEREQLVKFYLRVRPPGWWKQTALAADRQPAEAHRAFRRDLLGLLACAASVYGCLVGLGQMLLHGEWRVSGVLLIVVAVILTPVWLRIVREQA